MLKKQIFMDQMGACKIHQAALQVLARTGVELNHREAGEILLRAGARREDGRILIPPELVEEALEKVGREIKLYDRDGRSSLLLKNGNNYFGPGSDALYNLDLESWKIRKTVIADVARNVKIADRLGFDFIMSMGLPSDLPEKKLYGTIFAEMVKNTSRPLVVTLTTTDDIRHIHEIAAIVVGGKDKLRQKPFFLTYLEPISPLQMDESGVERFLYCVRNGLPVLYAAGANSGSGAPITAEGGVIQGTAESLAGLVLGWLVDRDIKFVFGANTSSMDMKKMIVAYGAPEWAKTVAMYAELGDYYQLPSWGTAGCSDTYRLDPQAAWESGESILMAVLSRTTMAHDVGYLGHGELYDPRMLVLTAEMIKRARHLLKPLSLAESNLEEITQVIDDVARGRDYYPSHLDTVKNFRQSLWLPPAYVFKGLYRESGEAQALPELLKDEVKEILSRKEPAGLSPEKIATIDRYLSSI